MEDKQDKETILSRRDFLSWAAAAAAAIVLPGCEPADPYYSSASAPRYVSAPRVSQPTTDYSAYLEPAPAPQPQVIYVQQEPAPAPQPRLAPAAAQPRRSQQPPAVQLRVNSRASWGATAAVPAKMKRMNGISRITIHHEGSAKPNNETTPQQVAATLRLIQSQHRKRMGAGDIGYHFIIDRTGQIWQGRDISYQGAHTSGANSNNLGIMLLGNFEIQQPTPQQLAALRLLVNNLLRKYGLNPRKDVYGHGDFCNTQCPGKNLKPHVRALRNM